MLFIEYWDVIENPTGETYQQLIKLLCDYSDQFYFVTRKELKYNKAILEKFHPYLIETYQTKEWANTRTFGPAATVYVLTANEETCKLLQELSTNLYDWIAPHLPEDLTFQKNNFSWFLSTTHEGFAGFSIRSDYYRNLIHQVDGLKIELATE